MCDMKKSGSLRGPLIFYGTPKLSQKLLPELQDAKPWRWPDAAKQIYC